MVQFKFVKIIFFENTGFQKKKEKICKIMHKQKTLIFTINTIKETIHKSFHSPKVGFYELCEQD